MSLHELQTKVHVGKDKRNDFGGYNYRTAEGILSAIKAALLEGETIIVTDTLQEVAGQIFVTATAILTLSDGEKHEAQGHAMHPLSKKGMDQSQITGAASSYARKYALSGLMALDDGSVDPDAGRAQHEEAPPVDPAAETKRLTDAINGQNAPILLDRLFNQPNFQAALSALPEPNKLAVRAAHKARVEYISGQG